MPCASDTVHGDWGAKLSPLEGSEAVVSHSGASQEIQLHTEPLPKELTSCPQLLTDAEVQGQRDCEGLNLTLLLIVSSWLVAWCEDLKSAPGHSQSSTGWKHNSCLAGPGEGKRPGLDGFLLRKLWARSPSSSSKYQNKQWHLCGDGGWGRRRSRCV